MTKLIGRHLSVKVGKKTLLHPTDIELDPGELVVLLGPNGGGKTSLIRAALALIKPHSGFSHVGEKDLARLSPMERARFVSYLPQQRPLAWPNIVRDVVALGRYSHGAASGRLIGADAQAIDRALIACDLVDYAYRHCDTLSGGELARVHCARAFCAETPLLIADEPMAALDPLHQYRTMDLIRGYVNAGGGALVVVHDIAIAARYASRLIWMKEGRIVANGSVHETLTSERINNVFGVQAQITGINVTIEGAHTVQ